MVKKKFSHIIPALVLAVSMVLIALPVSLWAQQYNITPPYLRGFTPRELKPRGQIRADYTSERARIRELRIQEERRPQDIPVPAQSMGDPEHARPVLFHLSRDRERLKTAMFGAGGVTHVPFYSAGFGASEYDAEDPSIKNLQQEETITEWWEMNERSRMQRGGWFRTRFGSRQPAQMQQQQQGGAGQIGPPGGGGGMGGGMAPGQNMPGGATPGTPGGMM